MNSADTKNTNKLTGTRSVVFVAFVSLSCIILFWGSFEWRIPASMAVVAAWFPIDRWLKRREPN